ncbi:hypothetical protein LUZ60_001643 [Juncus effusus]|nr:hypothetical protein LUZ60_001643 [Juncus effusus]
MGGGGKEDQEKNSNSNTNNSKRNLQKSYFDVLGLCCPSEVPLIERILGPLEGVEKVSVIVPSRTVIVVHDSLLISPAQIVKALNQARLEASIRAYGGEKIINKWPNPYIIACAILLIISLFKRFYHPLKWVALAAAAAGLPPILLRSIAAIRRFTLDINILMIIAVGGAIALRDYSEAGFIVFLFTTAEWLETRASHKAQAGMTSLMSMAPQKAILAETGESVNVEEVKVNTLLSVKAGEVIPIDGLVTDGRSEVDESSLTGESFPVPKQTGSQVWAGTLNIDGYISVRTTAMAENSAVARMARMVEEAQSNRSETQRLIDTCAKYYTPSVVVLSCGVAVVPLILKVRNPKHWFQLALVLLVSACPCALVLSTPIATFCALLKAARSGLLVKGGDVLEALAKVKVAAFDKTGTITKGEFNVREFKSLTREVSVDTLLYWVSSIESKSSHPMAAALVDYARSSSVEPRPDDVSDFIIYPGEGIYGLIDGKNIYVGNKRIVSRASSLPVPSMEGMEGVTAGYVMCGQDLIGLFSLSDSCRTGSKEAILELKSLGIKSVMLTGDSTSSATFAQNQLGNALEEIHSELLPADKVRIIEDLKSRVGPTLMIGDGMNDAPALASADVGISMGMSGSAVATQTGHITLMSNDIRKIPSAVRLARQTRMTVLVNIIFSVLTKVAIMCLAIAGHPLLWAAVLADVGTCLIVILNSMTILGKSQRKVDKKKKCCGPARKMNGHDGGEKTCGKMDECHVACCDEPAKEKGNNVCKDKCCGASTKEKEISTSCKDDCCGSVKKEKENSTSCKDKCCGSSEKEKENTRQEERKICVSSCCDEEKSCEEMKGCCWCDGTKCSHKNINSNSHSHSHSKCHAEPTKAKENTTLKEQKICAKSCCGAEKKKIEKKICVKSCCEVEKKKSEEQKICIKSCCGDKKKSEVIKETCKGERKEKCWCDGIGCSVGLEEMERRANGGECGKSYREEVVRREGHANGCCENGIVKLPEIVME